VGTGRELGEELALADVGDSGGEDPAAAGGDLVAHDGGQARIVVDGVTDVLEELLDVPGPLPLASAAVPPAFVFQGDGLVGGRVRGLVVFQRAVQGDHDGCPELVSCSLYT